MNVRTSTSPTTATPGKPPGRPGARVLVVVVAVLILAAGAVGAVLIVTDNDSDVVGTTSQSTAVTNPSTPTTLDPQAAVRAAVLAAYTQSFKAIIVVGRQTSQSPDDPRLSEHTSGPALIAKQRAIADNKAKGLVFVGDAELHPTIIELTADSATVVECAMDRTALVESRTGTTVVDAGPNEGIASTSKMRLEAGVWKVTDFKNEKRSCVPPAA